MRRKDKALAETILRLAWLKSRINNAGEFRQRCAIGFTTATFPFWEVWHQTKGHPL